MCTRKPLNSRAKWQIDDTMIIYHILPNHCNTQIWKLITEIFRWWKQLRHHCQWPFPCAWDRWSTEAEVCDNANRWFACHPHSASADLLRMYSGSLHQLSFLPKRDVGRLRQYCCQEHSLLHCCRIESDGPSASHNTCKPKTSVTQHTKVGRISKSL